MDDSMPVLQKVDLTLDMFLKVWDAERYLLRLQRIADVMECGKDCDAEQMNSELDYPEPLLLTAFALVKEKYENEQVLLNEELLREIHQAIQDAFSILYPHIPTEFIPREAYEFYNRGNIKIHQSRYQEAIADFTQANEMEPNNHIFEFALAQYWFRYGHDNVIALIWVDKSVSHIPEDSVFERVFYHQLKVDICTPLREYGKAILSLQTSIENLRSLVENLEWNNGEASMGEGKTIYAEGVRQSLAQATDSAKQLLNLVDATEVSQVETVFRVLRKLFKQL